MINKENTTTSIIYFLTLSPFQLHPISRTKYSFHTMFSKIEKGVFPEDIKMSFMVGFCESMRRHGGGMLPPYING
jgi:hypothetical protein